MSDKRENELGALWKKTSKAGKPYMSGKIKTPAGEELSVVVFTNDYKKEEKHPDYRIMKSEPRNEQAQQQTRDEDAAKWDTFTDDVPF